MSFQILDHRFFFGSFLIGTELLEDGPNLVVIFAIYRFGSHQPVYELIPGRLIVYGAAARLVLVSAWQAYQNRSLVASLLLCIAPVTGLFLNIIGEGQIGNPGVGETLLLGIARGLLFGVPLGLLGFILGYAGRRVIDTKIQT